MINCCSKIISHHHWWFITESYTMTHSYRVCDPHARGVLPRRVRRAQQGAVEACESDSIGDMNYHNTGQGDGRGYGREGLSCTVNYQTSSLVSISVHSITPAFQIQCAINCCVCVSFGMIPQSLLCFQSNKLLPELTLKEEPREISSWVHAVLGECTRCFICQSAKLMASSHFFLPTCFYCRSVLRPSTTENKPLSHEWRPMGFHTSRCNGRCSRSSPDPSLDWAKELLP